MELCIKISCDCKWHLWFFPMWQMSEPPAVSRHYSNTRRATNPQVLSLIKEELRRCSFNFVHSSRLWLHTLFDLWLHSCIASSLSLLALSIHEWCSTSKWVSPSLPHIPPALLVSQSHLPLRFPFFPRYMHLYRVFFSLLLLMCLPCAAALSSLGSPSSHFSAWFIFCHASSHGVSACCKMTTPAPLTHTQVVTVLVGLYVQAGHMAWRWRLLCTSELLFWLVEAVRPYDAAKDVYDWAMPNQRLLLCSHACITYICVHYKHTAVT